MKKLVFMFAAVVAMSFATSCNETAKGDANDSCCADSCCDTTVVEETVDTVDTTAVDTTANL